MTQAISRAQHLSTSITVSLNTPAKSVSLLAIILLLTKQDIFRYLLHVNAHFLQDKTSQINSQGGKISKKGWRNNLFIIVTIHVCLYSGDSKQP